MPIYNYKCGNCGAIQEKMLKINDSPDYMSMDCPECGIKKGLFSKTIAAPSGFRFKGSGFYKETSTFD